MSLLESPTGNPGAPCSGEEKVVLILVGLIGSGKVGIFQILSVLAVRCFQTSDIMDLEYLRGGIRTTFPSLSPM